MANRSKAVAAAQFAITLSLLAPSLHCIKSAASESAPDAGKTAPVQVATPASPAPRATPALAAPSPALRDDCKEICEPSAKLKCKSGSDCLPNCIAMATMTPCTPEISAFFGCLKGQPLKNWECSEDGVAAIRPGICDGEQGKAVGCMEEKMRN